MAYIPKELKHLNVKFKLLKIKVTKVLGADEITEEEIGEFFANYKTYGGTEQVVNGKTVISDTGEVTTFYRPDITKDCVLIRVIDNAKFEILSEPENIEMRNVALKFKIERLTGKF